MQISLIKTPFEYVQIDNTYTEEEAYLIFLELNFLTLSGNLLPPEATGGAKDHNTKQVLKRNQGIFLDNVYQNRNSSNILNFNRKLFNINIDAPSVVLNYLKYSNTDTTLISYYENSDYYAPHRDTAILTTLTYLYAQPKKFVGGDLVFPDYGLTLEPVYNRTYIIPSVVEHEVTPVIIAESDTGKGFGRYCISGFVTKVQTE